MSGKSTIPRKANYQYFDMANILKDWKPNIKDNVIIAIFVMAFSAAIGICFYFGILNGLTSLCATVAGVIAGFAFYGWGQYNNNVFSGANQKFAIISYLVLASSATFGIMIVMNVFYDMSFLAIFSADWLGQIYWMIGFLYVCYLGIASMELWKHIEMKMQSKIVMDLSMMIIPAVALMLVMFNLIPTTQAGTYYFALMIGVVPLYVVFTYLSWKKNKDQSNWENMRQILMLYGLSLGVSFAVLLFVIDPFGWNMFGLASIAGHIPIIPGQGTTTNYFSYIWYIFFQSPTAAIMIAIMTFGTVVNIFSSTMGGALKGATVIGVIITVVPPMIIILEIFAGGIPPPDLLADLLGTGVASFIFALCEVGVFVIIAIILSVFSGVADLLSSKASAKLG